MKDPAFLFYSKDFYEGTRMMLPDERACYIDLLVYQHQNGLIPLELNRILMYCSGINEATLIATLEGKFKKTDKGWYNERLQTTIDERREYSRKQSENGILGQFFKKAKVITNATELKQLKDYVYNTIGKNKIISELLNSDNIETTLQATLKGLGKHLEDVNANVDVIKSNKGEFNFRKSLIALGIEENIATDWLKVRKSKKATNTETAFNKIKTELLKAKPSPNECIKIAVEKSWSGFNNEWLRSTSSQGSYNLDFEQYTNK